MRPPGSAKRISRESRKARRKSLCGVEQGEQAVAHDVGALAVAGEDPGRRAVALDQPADQHVGVGLDGAPYMASSAPVPGGRAGRSGRRTRRGATASPTLRPRIGEPVCARCSTLTFGRTAATASSRSACRRPTRRPRRSLRIRPTASSAPAANGRTRRTRISGPGSDTGTTTLTFTPMRPACAGPVPGAVRLADGEGRPISTSPWPGSGPRRRRGAVAGLDIAEAPLDLGGGVGLPVAARAGHLGAGKGLGDAVGAAGSGSSPARSSRSPSSRATPGSPTGRASPARGHLLGPAPCCCRGWCVPGGSFCGLNPSPPGAS